MSRPGRSLPPGKTRYPLYRRLGGPQGQSGQVRKIPPPPGFDPQTVQPAVSRYTDYATRPTSSESSVSKARTSPVVCLPWVFILKSEDSWQSHKFLHLTISHRSLDQFTFVHNLFIKVKVVPCTIMIWMCVGQWKLSPLLSQLHSQMEMSNRLHGPTSFLPRKMSWIRNKQKARTAAELVWMWWQTQNTFHQDVF